MPETTAYDTGNPLLAEVVAGLQTALVEVNGKQRLFLTIRTQTTTVTVILNAERARKWADDMNTAAGRMSQSGLIVAGRATGSADAPPALPG